MVFTPLPLAGAFVITPAFSADNRGAFGRTFCRRLFAEHNLEGDFVQINQSQNARKGTLRGLHYQHPPMAEAKYIRCIRGAVYDVIVDIRKGSPTLMQHAGVELSAQNQQGIYVPHGFAHGFITLQDDTELVYHHTEYYALGHEGGLRYNDPALGIKWPLTPTVMSAKDPLYPLISETAFTGITI